MPVSEVERIKLLSDGGRESFTVFSKGYNLFEGGFDSLRYKLVR